MPEKRIKEHSKDEIVAIFDKLLANASRSGDEDSENDIDAPEEVQNLKEEPETQKLVLEGRNKITKGNFGEAMKFFNQALELDPQCWDAWSAMGDALMEMGKIDQASICYKKAMASSFQLEEDLLAIAKTELKNSDLENDTKENDWQDYLMTFLENKKDETEQISPKIGNSTQIPEKNQPESEGLDADLEELFKMKEGKDIQTTKEIVHFPCPACGSDVELDSGICSQCQTTFKEERFENYESIDDDIVFFSKIKELLGKRDRFFIHFNGEDGSIRFLDKRETSRTKKPSYVFVSANIEQLCYDYAAGARKTVEPSDIEIDAEEE